LGAVGGQVWQSGPTVVSPMAGVIATTGWLPPAELVADPPGGGVAKPWFGGPGSGSGGSLRGRSRGGGDCDGRLVQQPASTRTATKPTRMVRIFA
jgi:hypothetical protein